MGKRNILVVEDEPIVGFTIRQTLENLDYNVIAVVASGDESFQIILEKAPDLVLLDIHLEGHMDGIQIAEKLNEQFQIPVIFLTADTDENILRRAYQVSPNGFIKKPFSPSELEMTVQNGLNRVLTNRIFSEHQLDFIYELKQMEIGAIIFDSTGIMYFINPVGENLLGLKMNHLFGESIFLHVPENKLNLNQLRNGSLNFRYAFSHPTTKSCMDLEFHAFVFSDSAELFSGTVMLFHSSNSVPDFKWFETLLKKLDFLFFKKRNPHQFLEKLPLEDLESKNHLKHWLDDYCSQLIQWIHLLHTGRHRLEHFHFIDLVRFVMEKAHDISNKRKTAISIDLEIQTIPLPNRVVLSLTLILSEFILHYLWNSFAEKKNGKIHLSFKKEAETNQIVFVLKDDAVKINDFSQSEKSCFMIPFVQNLTQSLQGEMMTFHNQGTHFEIRFPLLNS